MSQGADTDHLMQHDSWPCTWPPKPLLMLVISKLCTQSHSWPTLTLGCAQIEPWWGEWDRSTVCATVTWCWNPFLVPVMLDKERNGTLETKSSSALFLPDPVSAAWDRFAKITEDKGWWGTERAPSPLPKGQRGGGRGLAEDGLIFYTDRQMPYFYPKSGWLLLGI